LFACRPGETAWPRQHPNKPIMHIIFSLVNMLS
jgi:hypothetical protein